MNGTEKEQYEEKFANFIRMCLEAKRSHVDAVVVASRWVIGDTEEERQESLMRLEIAGLELIVLDEKNNA
jgi:hypothetical protein